jgi:hypothetical protein
VPHFEAKYCCLQLEGALIFDLFAARYHQNGGQAFCRSAKDLIFKAAGCASLPVKIQQPIPKLFKMDKKRLYQTIETK